jgi:PAS domain S-box-containing protein
VVTSVNPRAGELLGLDFDAIGRPLAEVCVDVGLEQLSCMTLRTRQPSPERDFAVSQTGSRQRLRAKCYLLKDATGACPGTLLIVRDVTERVLMEERLRRMERYMGLGTLAAGLHHEIKNPLGALSLHIQLLEEKLEDSADEGPVEHLSIVKTEAARISEVLETFRDFASVERLDQQATDLGPLIEQAQRLIAPQADRQNVRVQVGLQEGPAIRADVDAARTEQVVLNLLLNSLDEMSDGGDLTLRLMADKQNAYIEVEDTGPGIPEGVQSRVFDPYFTTKSRGSGMGLAISQKIMQQHAGDIDFESGPEGTVFRLTIPRTNPDHKRS